MGPGFFVCAYWADRKGGMGDCVVTDTPWEFASQHNVPRPDVFRMTGPLDENFPASQYSRQEPPAGGISAGRKGPQEGGW